MLGARCEFIFLTAKTEPQDLRQGMNLGADDYLMKPFTRHQLLEAVQVRLQKQAVVMAKIQAERQRAMTLEQQLQQQRLNAAEDQGLPTDLDLENLLGKINLAIYMLKQIQPGAQQDCYREILAAECVREIELLNQVIDLQDFLPKHNIAFLREMNLLRSNAHE